MSAPLSWRAIWIGAAVSIGATLLLMLSGSIYVVLADWIGDAALGWALRLFGFAADAVGGFVAGRIAGRDGALHGLLAGALAAAAGIAISLPQMLLYGTYPDSVGWLVVAGWYFVGVALAFLGGALGAQSRRSGAR